ncbi:YfhE family protein [Ornithinibacillus halophilus]|uniref:YfhE-like protein n=1 Tax=Ornithinibacillus halophilus TaxID=930117 RepID=A0A1M5MNQ4_9BACI|nr:YfhE family protein [Ornithinibacillus halophilus]SHG78817.1 YfhE-like protein [Ornithinibacillus halophilus]
MAKEKRDKRAKNLNSTQEVLYQKEFKMADQAYNQFTKKENRS